MTEDYKIFLVFLLYVKKINAIPFRKPSAPSVCKTRHGQKSLNITVHRCGIHTSVLFQIFITIAKNIQDV